MVVEEHGESTCGHHAREPASGSAAAVRRHWKEKKSGFAVSGLAIERHRDRQTTSEGKGRGSEREEGSVRFDPLLVAEEAVGGRHAHLPPAPDKRPARFTRHPPSSPSVTTAEWT